jgi:hypothetical protein
MIADPKIPDEHPIPKPLQRVNGLVLDAMAWINGLAHFVLGLALAASIILFTWLFFKDVVAGFSHENMAQGFLHGLGTLMLLWTVSALITAEMRYMKGHKLQVDTFVEVAIVVLLRKLITMPVQSTLPSPQEFLLWVASAVALGLMYLLVRYALTVEHKD